MSVRHRSGQQAGAQAAGIGSGNRRREEKPYMGTVPGAGALYRRDKPHVLATFAECSHIKLPVFFIKIRSQQPSRVILQHRIDCYHISAQWITANQMCFDHLGGKRFELTIGALRALMLLFVAQTIHPFIFTDGRISAFSCLDAVVPACIHIFPAFEYREEKFNFLLCGTVCVNRGGMRIL